MAGSKKAAPPPPYAFEDDIEQAVVLACCGEPRFYKAIGAALDPDRLRNPSAKMLVAAAHAIAHKTSQPPSWPSLATQHLATLMSQGKVTLDQLEDAKDYMLAALELPAVSTEELIASIVPIVQRVKHKEAIVEALDGFKNNLSPADTAAAFESVAKLGKSAVTTVQMIEDITGAADFFSDKEEEKLRFGVQELDDAIEGGLEKQALGLIVGGSGAGKSMALAHASVEALLDGNDVLYVSLELSVNRVTQRLTRNLLDLTKREIRGDVAFAQKRLALVYATPTIGRFAVAYAEPLVTSPKDIRKIIEDSMRQNPGFNPNVFVVDFMDKLRVNPKASLYEDMLAVADGLRTLAVDFDGWTWTASQSDRKSTNRPWLDLDAVADSMNKIRSADLVIAVGRTEEDKQQDLIRFSIPKRREGEGAHTRVGPIAWDPEHGRIAVVSNRNYPW